MRSAIITLALGAAMAVAGAANAEPVDKAATDDLRCVFVALAGADAKDKAAGQGQAMMVGYYLGRFESRQPDADVGRELDRTAREFDTLSDAEFKKAVEGCFERMQLSQNNFGDWLKKRS